MVESMFVALLSFNSPAGTCTQFGMTSGFIWYACPCARLKSSSVYQSTLTDVQKVLNQHQQNLTHLSSGCSTQHPKKCLQWWTVWSASSRLFNSQNMSVILLNTWMLKYKSLLRDITNITWSCLVLLPNGGMEVKLVNIPVINVLVLPSGRLPLTSFLLAGLCGIIQRRCLGSTSLLCSCAIGENHCKLVNFS